MNENKRDYVKVFNITAIVAFAIFAASYVAMVAFFKAPNGVISIKEMLPCLPLAVISFVLSFINMAISREKVAFDKKTLNFIMFIFPAAFIFVSILGLAS